MKTASVMFMAGVAIVSSGASAQFAASYEGGDGPAGGLVDPVGTTFDNRGPYTLNGFPLQGRFGDLASTPAGGTVFAVGTQAGSPNLFSVDPATNASTLRGRITLQGNDLAGAGEGGIAAGPSGAVRLVANVGGVSALFNLNPATGDATLLGNLTLGGFSLVASDVLGLATDAADNTYGVLTVGGSTGLYTIAGDGAATFRGELQLNGVPIGGRVADVAFDAGGTLYTLVSFGNTHSFFTVNPGTGALALRGNLDYVSLTPFTGLANVPAPSALAVLALAASALGRRRVR